MPDHHYHAIGRDCKRGALASPGVLYHGTDGYGSSFTRLADNCGNISLFCEGRLLTRWQVTTVDHPEGPRIASQRALRANPFFRPTPQQAEAIAGFNGFTGF
jgi:hypothetical protein